VNLIVHTQCRHPHEAPAPAEPVLLLEGAWPVGDASESHMALDEIIDARHEWIDLEASRLAECLSDASLPSSQPGENMPQGAYLNARTLRYYLVKLLRVVAYFTEIRPLSPGDRVELLAARRRDEDYADVLEAICHQAGASLRVRWTPAPKPNPVSFPGNPPWRRWAPNLLEKLVPRCRESGPRVVLLGNPRLLDPVCGALLGRGCQPWWLYDRFAFGTWRRWRLAGVRQLVCDANQGRRNSLSPQLPHRVFCRGIDLTTPIERWLASRLAEHGTRQTRFVERIDAHFRALRPDALVLDEDATPFARAALAMARHHGAASFVVQHGVTGCRFGFAPLGADYFFAWGNSSREQMMQWGVAPERILVTGSAQHDGWLAEGGFSALQGLRTSKNNAPRILLLATVPPSDARPDAVSLHFTRETYAEMLRVALASVAKLDGARLAVKLHPRVARDPILAEVLAAFPSVSCRVGRGGNLRSWLKDADCVLSCFSSAGIEASLVGVPVIQLLPVGSQGLLPCDRWGLFADVKTEAELDRTLADVFQGGHRSVTVPWRNVFANLDGPASGIIAEHVLARCRGTVSSQNQPYAIGTARCARERERELSK